MMKFFVLNPELDDKIKRIKTKIRLSMDGVVAEKLTTMGVIYKKNYGVSLPRLQVLANEFGQNYDVALRLWNMRERETMILAILTMPLDKMNEALASEWMLDISNIELSEQMSMHLIPNLSFAKALCFKMMAHEKDWPKICAFQSLARMYATFSEQEVALVSQNVENLLETDNVYLQKSMARCLSRFSRKHPGWVEKWANDTLRNCETNRTCAILNDEITQELKYF